MIAVFRSVCAEPVPAPHVGRQPGRQRDRQLPLVRLHAHRLASEDSMVEVDITSTDSLQFGSDFDFFVLVPEPAVLLKGR